MLPCCFYAKNRDKAGFKCPYSAVNFWGYQTADGEKTVRYDDCPNLLICVKLSGEHFRHYKKANAVVNDYGNGKLEIVHHKKDFSVMTVNVNDNIDRSRSFKKVGGILIPRKKKATPAKLSRIIEKSTNRAHKNFNLASRANTWSYFFTFTFSPSVVNRFDDDVIKACWRKLQRRLKYIDADVKIMEVHERHENGALHFHAPITFTKDLPIVDYGDISRLPQRTCNGGKDKGKTGFCTFTREGKFTLLPDTHYKVFLVPYYSYGEIQRSSLGDMLFCLNCYKYGINSCAILPLDDTNQGKVASYLSTYCSKQSNLGYNTKRFRCSRNLARGVSYSANIDSHELDDIVSLNNMRVYKETDRLTIFRTDNLCSQNNEK